MTDNENKEKEKAEFMLRCFSAIFSGDQDALIEMEREVLEDLKKRRQNKHENIT